MRRTTTYFLMALGALCSSGQAQTDYWVVLPGDIDKATQTTLSTSLVQLVGGGEAGDRFVFIDGQELRRVIAFDRPEARSSRSLSRRLRREYAALAAHLKGELVEGKPSLEANAVLHPQALAMVASQRTSERTTRCVLFGSPFYRNPREPSFAMGDGLYPSDAHLGAAPSSSIYSCKGRERELAGCAVYFCYLNEGFANSFERGSVRRWWTLFVAAQGGVCAHLSASAPDALEAALKGSKRPAVSATVDPRDERVEMRRAGAEVPVEPRSQLEAAADAIPAPAKGKFTVAAFWPVAAGSRVDVDVHLQARPGAEEISFRKKKTKDGRLLRDVTGGSRRGENEEWRASWEVVEVNETALREAKAWLNLFAYRGPGPIEGIVRVGVGTRHVDLPFAFAAGVQGDGRLLEQTKRGRSSHWVEVDLAAAFERLGGGSSR